MKRRSWIGMTLCVAIAGSAALLSELVTPRPVPAQVPEVIEILPDSLAGIEPFPLMGWPDGDADEGRQAFRDLKCTQCHSVPSDPELAALNRGGPGPDLVGHEHRKRSRLFTVRQIVSPGADLAGQESHMGNFGYVMTVQQLTDLVAFLEALPPQE